MRKMMTKKVTSTTIKTVKVENNDGELKVIPLEDVTMLGNIDIKRAQRLMDKEYDFPVTVTEVNSETVVYEMEVTEFMKVATIKTEKEEENETEGEDE